jgi:hypothetical protein
MLTGRQSARKGGHASTDADNVGTFGDGHEIERYPQLCAMNIADWPEIARRIADVASWGDLLAEWLP